MEDSILVVELKSSAQFLIAPYQGGAIPCLRSQYQAYFLNHSTAQ